MARDVEQFAYLVLRVNIRMSMRCPHSPPQLRSGRHNRRGRVKTGLRFREDSAALLSLTGSGQTRISLTSSIDQLWQGFAD
jgi:hypothetical protein